jgi:hypothetical protein
MATTMVLVLAHTVRAQPTEPSEPQPQEAGSAATEPTPAPVESAPAPATPSPPTPEAPATTSEWDAGGVDEPADSLQIHGWVSQGAMLSTGNDYLARTKRGSFEFFESGINVTKEIGTKLRAGIQIFAQDLGPEGNYKPIVDWAYVDYKLRPWLGVRAGRFKMPMFLYSDQLDADMARTTVLMPQSVYDVHFRQFLAALTGVDLYGRVELGAAGSVDYDLYAGTVFVELWDDDWDVENVVGSRVVWNTPVSCLRVAGHYQYANWNETEQINDVQRDALKMAGLAPADWDGRLTTTADDWTMAGGGLECETDRMTFTAEASWWRSTFSLTPEFQMPFKFDQLRAYVQAAFRVTDRLSTSLYVSAFRDSQAGQDPSEDANHQYDTAVSVRYDVTPNFLVKAEAHLIDGYRAALQDDLPQPEEHASRWGLFLVKTTLAF